MVYIKRAVGLILYLAFISLIGLFFYVLSSGFFAPTGNN